MPSPSIEAKPLFERTHFLAGFLVLVFSCLKLYKGTVIGSISHRFCDTNPCIDSVRTLC